jgi:hypothetical protein
VNLPALPACTIRMIRVLADNGLQPCQIARDTDTSLDDVIAVLDADDPTWLEIQLEDARAAVADLERRIARLTAGASASLPEVPNLETYLRTAIEGFRQDPPDSDFQRGYLGALEELQRVFVPAEGRKLWSVN